MKRGLSLLVSLTLFVIQMQSQCWKQVSPGVGFTLAIKTDGTLWSWGWNNSGQLGTGNTTDKLWPVQVGSANDWLMAAAGSEYSFAIKTDGTLWAWGANYNGFLGLGYNSPTELLPIQVGAATDWAFVYPGVGQHTLALKTDGTLWGWGYNGSGELGLGNNNFIYNSPQQIGTATNWQTVSAGPGHSLAVKTDGTLWAWGNNTDGQLGIGNNTNSNVPIQVGTASDWKSISAGFYFSIGLKTNGTVWGWGTNDIGQLGAGNTIYTNVPVQEVTLSSNWKSVTTGQDLTQALKTDNTLWAWGYGYNGDNFISTTTPEQAGTDSNWDTVAVKWNHGAGMKTGNTLSAWGDNIFGELGDGTTTSSLNVPVTCNNVLPVTWLYVKGKLQNNHAILEWGTASENNNSHFEVEHSSNGLSFAKAGTVSAAGNSNSINRYSFTHLLPGAGKNYYRIKQVDLDGRYGYSRIVVLINSTLQNTIILSPNPAQDFIQLNTNTTAPGTIRIFSMDGKLWLQQPLPAGNQQLSLDISKLPGGIYTLQWQTSDNLKTVSFIKR